MATVQPESVKGVPTAAYGEERDFFSALDREARNYQLCVVIYQIMPNDERLAMSCA